MCFITNVLHHQEYMVSTHMHAEGPYAWALECACPCCKYSMRECNGGRLELRVLAARGGIFV